MKKVNLTGKLSIKKDTVVKLNNEQMNMIIGGSIATGKSCCVYTTSDPLHCSPTAASGCC
ncbi:MAG: class I lanthipeptide [Bacteroidetes bacterium]|nr:class I lanthipeptide [Bacteroidota bacterium]